MSYRGFEVGLRVYQTYLGNASLLAKSCKAAMMLANHDEPIQEKAFKFGENMAYAYQVCYSCYALINDRLHL